ncbi:hypothetical protein SAMN05421770_10525 [Granulicella rosea]|uniref:Quinol monooxygenase YgiN n=1 Tax=Granulicella rosea TaxID=474952 RepID=A0A239KM08_9BACT|nr:hypothetical protein [Granulicella rosea]SNT18653.1 hypothetical protein SAMN05421770_10525 [Granulicella rosea]
MRLIRVFALAAALCAPASHAQTPLPTKPAAPACDGVVVMVRVSEITPGGSAEKFMAAVAAHRAWFKAHGARDNQIVVARIEDHGAYSGTKFITYHINPPATEPVRDAGFDAFVKLYADTSKITESYRTCMPETVVSTDPTPWMKM